MNNENNDTFQFGEQINAEEDNNFNYEGIVGLGESDYENEDLFSTETLNLDYVFDSQDDATTSNVEGGNTESKEIDENFNQEESVDSSETHLENNLDNQSEQNDEVQTLDIEDSETQNEVVIDQDEENIVFSKEDELPVEDIKESEELEIKEKADEEIPDDVLVEKESVENLDSNDEIIETDDSDMALEQPQSNEEVKTLENLSGQTLFSDTPVEEFNKLTQFGDEKVQSTDIKALFDRVGVNVKEASDIFRKNTEMKEKIDSRFEELKKLQAEVEKSKSSQYDEINAYKEEVLNKLTEKKQEIERRIEKLKDYQASLENEKEEFEQYKRKEKEEIERVQKEIQEAYDSRREELSHVEDVLRRQKDSLDEERSQLTLDRIQYESDKNELANNLLKFNEIVDSFTSGMNKLDKE